MRNLIDEFARRRPEPDGHRLAHPDAHLQPHESACISAFQTMPGRRKTSLGSEKIGSISPASSSPADPPTLNPAPRCMGD
ncbi:MAG: hypothetical protein R3F11_07700 [Verrucomicrobiales bacterium]